MSFKPMVPINHITKLNLSAIFTLFFLLAMLVDARPIIANDDPQWFDNNIGEDDVLLPGFEPVELAARQVRLFGRVYDWDNNFLPATVSSLAEYLAGPMQLRLKTKGAYVTLKPHTYKVLSHDRDHAVILTSGEPLAGLKVTCETRVEYDGVATVKISLVPNQPVKVQGFDLFIETAISPLTNILTFKAKGIRRQKQRQDFIATPYKGPFLNVISIADGKKSFWWFADDARGWIWNSDSVTEIFRAGGKLILRQRLIGESWLINSPMAFHFNFLATPVKKVAADWRSQRVIYGAPSKKEAVLGGKYRLWWPEAFAYDAFPYTVYPPAAKEKLSPKDRNAYPGLKANQEKVKHDLAKFGIHWIPYFSAHVLSELDPVLAKNRKRWEVLPPKIFKDGNRPYSNKFSKPVLTHRAKSYTNYLLRRFDEEIDRLGAAGLYLDHAPPVDTINPENGGWADSNGVMQPALDILGLRQFFKRLKTLFYLKGKPGYLFAHVSNREIIPAYTFLTAMVDGEQYKYDSGLIDGDYIGLLSLSEIRARISHSQYGVLNIWLAEEWSRHPSGSPWWGSRNQLLAFRNHMALALLHDIPVWPKGAPYEERKKVYNMLDRFGVDLAEFVPYWESATAVTADQPEVYVSFYRHLQRKAALLVVANLSPARRQMELRFSPGALGINGGHNGFVIFDENGKQLRHGMDRVTVQINGKDFELISIEAAG